MIDFDKPLKPLQTRDGLPVRIYARDGVAPYPIHGAIKTDSGWVSVRWTAKGHISEFNESPNDLVNVKIKKSGWTAIANFYSGAAITSSHIYRTEKEARESHPDAFAIIPIEWEEMV